MALIIKNLDLEKLHGDDRNVFNQVFDFYYEDISSFCNYRLDDWHDVEEIIQKIFAELWNKRQSIRNSKHLCKLLYTITKRRVSNYLRNLKRQKIRTNELDDTDHNTPAPLQTNPLFEEIARELYNHDILWGEIALEEMEKLPQQCREVLRMRMINNKKRAEIAKILRINPKTVDAHIAYAKKLLKKTLLEKGYNRPLTILWAVLLFFLK
jgi:RNA polymerase sigma factor (sigma-70 family)